MAGAAWRQTPRPDAEDGRGDRAAREGTGGTFHAGEWLGHHGDPVHRGDAAQKFRYFAGWTDKIRGETLSSWAGSAHNYVAYEPYGVIGAIIPWNGPLFAATMVVAPALAAGNCVIMKAPELAPFAVMRLGELFLEAGFPPGVVNTLAGGPEVGEAMVAHPGIDKIQFVGSGATAKKVLRTAAETLKPCGLELGGKSAVIVFADADLSQAARRGLAGRHQRQRPGLRQRHPPVGGAVHL